MGFNTQDTKSDLVIHEKLGLGLVEKSKEKPQSRGLWNTASKARICRKSLFTGTLD